MIGYSTFTTYLDNDERIEVIKLAGRYNRLGENELLYSSLRKRVVNLSAKDKQEVVDKDGEGTAHEGSDGGGRMNIVKRARYQTRAQQDQQSSGALNNVSVNV